MENSVLRYLNNDGEVVEDDDDSFCYYECRFVIDEVNHVLQWCLMTQSRVILYFTMVDNK